MYEEYRRRCADGRFGLGDLFVWETPEQHVLNLGTQRTWRSGADLAAVGSAVRKTVHWAEAHQVEAVGLPRIGAGLGGLDWAQVVATIEPIAAPSTVRLVMFERLPGPEAASLRLDEDRR